MYTNNHEQIKTALSKAERFPVRPNYSKINKTTANGMF